MLLANGHQITNRDAPDWLAHLLSPHHRPLRSKKEEKKSKKDNPVVFLFFLLPEGLVLYSGRHLDRPTERATHFLLAVLKHRSCFYSPWDIIGGPRIRARAANLPGAMVRPLPVVVALEVFILYSPGATVNGRPCCSSAATLDTNISIPLENGICDVDMNNMACACDGGDM